MRWRFIGVSIRRTTPSWSSPATSRADEVKADAEETYGKVADRAPTNPRQRPMEPVQEAPRTVTLADPRVEQPSVSRDYLVPSETTAKPGESEALDVLAHVLGSGEDCRLYRTLGRR